MSRAQSSSVSLEDKELERSAETVISFMILFIELINLCIIINIVVRQKQRNKSYNYI